MKHLILVLSFLILFCISFLSWFILLWDPTLLPALGQALPRLYTDNLGRILFIAIGLITLGCSLSLLAMLLGVEPSVRKHIILENESGTVGPSLDAIEEFVKRRGTAVRGVRDLHVKAEIVEGGLIIRNKVVLELQRNVPEFIRDFQAVIGHELKETLGLSDVKEVRVLIHKLFPREGGKEPMLLSGPQQVLLKAEEVAETPAPDAAEPAVEALQAESAAGEEERSSNP